MFKLHSLSLNKATIFNPNLIANFYNNKTLSKFKQLQAAPPIHPLETTEYNLSIDTLVAPSYRVIELATR